MDLGVQVSVSWVLSRHCGYGEAEIDLDLEA